MTEYFVKCPQGIARKRDVLQKGVGCETARPPFYKAAGVCLYTGGIMCDSKTPAISEGKSVTACIFPEPRK